MLFYPTPKMVTDHIERIDNNNSARKRAYVVQEKSYLFRTRISILQKGFLLNDISHDIKEMRHHDRLLKIRSKD